MKFYILSATLFLSLQLNAQLRLPDARSMSLSETSVAFIPAYGMPDNIAALHLVKNSFIETAATNRYYLPELTSYSVSCSKKIDDNNAVSLALARMGSSIASEQFVRLGISKRLAGKLSAGVAMQYHVWKLADAKYSGNHALIPEAGLLINVMNDLNFGVVVRNPVRVRMNATEEKPLPATLKTGMNIIVSDKINLLVSASSETGRPLSYGLAINYSYARVLTVRAGYHTEPASASLGFELKVMQLSITAAYSTLQLPGNCSALSLTFPL
jgi:hypothetical protein